MKRTNLLWLILVSAAVALLGMALSACDTVDTPAADATVSNEELAALSLDLAESVPLSEVGQQSLDGVLAAHEFRVMEPGFLWYVAAGLQQTLGEEQKARMISLLDRIQRERWQDIRQNGPRRRFRAAFGPGPLNPIFEDLTEEQKQALLEIHERYAEEVRTVLESLRAGDIERETARAELDAIHEAQREEVKGVLTEEQVEALEEWREDREERRADRREAQREAMIDALDLTDSQVEELEALYQERQSELAEWRAGFWDNEFDPGAFWEDRLEIHEELQVALQDILTVAQYEALQIHQVLVHRFERVKNRSRGFGYLGGGPETGGPAGG